VACQGSRDDSVDFRFFIDQRVSSRYTARMPAKSELLGALRRYWGYDSFRPMQEKIVGSLLGGRDACVIMPTGGGKSLCYQLPAALLDQQTVIVVSPLIALMQDQVAQLAQMGLSAALLNSSLSSAEQSVVMRKAAHGDYRLLYLSPERLAREDTIRWLQKVPVSFFAIDEAHCISEWGHEFRPEYRQLSSLRKNFPEKPIAAFTASATQHVRHDIVRQLQLRAPDKYLASFHRPNLRYLVQECDARSQEPLLLKTLRRHAGSNTIVYAPTTAKVDEMVESLAAQGIAAIGYHGKMDAETRRRNQERWMSDEVRVLVGTLAFGLGINKAAVRAVIHLALPKSIEQYYQEAGRAGRDGAEADCLLLWQKRDVGLLAYFIEQLTDAAEKKCAWERYREIKSFAEASYCRHRRICEHFGEKFKLPRCGACDVCGCGTDWMAAPDLSKPVKRKKKFAKSSAPPQPGRHYAPAEERSAPRAARHDYGEDLRAWQKFKEQNAKPAERSPAPGAAVSEAEAELREYLREWRRNTARAQGTAAFIVMHDASLNALCQKQPRSLSELLEVSGFGERKVELYGQQILDALKRFREGERAADTVEKNQKSVAAAV
jgi:ATP-dependent DNA helicase RecQ